MCKSARNTGGNLVETLDSDPRILRPPENPRKKILLLTIPII
jgi:hypothetical protein